MFLKSFIVLRCWPSSGLMQCVVVKCSDILDECTASFFRVTGLVFMDAEVLRRKISVDYIRQFEVVWSLSAMEGGKLGQDCPELHVVTSCQVTV